MDYEEIERKIVNEMKLNWTYTLDHQGLWLNDWDKKEKKIIVENDHLEALLDIELQNLLKIILRLNEGKLVLL